LVTNGKPLAGSFTNAMASIGETVAPALKKLADWLGELASRLDGFVKRHPIDLCAV
jgi:hypothetical protein